MSEILGIASSAAGGGLFGLLGTGLGRIVGYFETRQKLNHERERWVHDTKMAELQMTAARERASADIAQTNAEGSWAGLSASLEADAAIGESYPWVSAVRGLTRPMLTFLLWLITLTIFMNTPAEGRTDLINTATFAATAATLWWFGDRGPRSQTTHPALRPAAPSTLAEPKP
jgi:hypothetical protein